jgi:hypothetical protein
MDRAGIAKNEGLKDQPAQRAGISDRSGVTDAVRVQILATEHWNLLATRSMIWNEVFSRASMYITVLSAAVVALALMAQATQFGAQFRLFALLVLPVVLLVGIATLLRLSQANSEDAGLVVGMNRLRHAYLELAPELEPYFSTGFHDDMRGVALTYGVHNNLGFGRIIGGTPNVVAAINVVIFGVYAALIADTLGVQPMTKIVMIGVAAAILAAIGHFAVGFQTIRRAKKNHRVRFPGP